MRLELTARQKAKKYCAVCNSIEDVADYQLKDGPKIRLCKKCANDWFPRVCRFNHRDNELHVEHGTKNARRARRIYPDGQREQSET